MFGRKLLWVYALLMLVAALGYARYDLYMMDGDGTAFLDLAQDLITHHAGLAINGYWNPAYPAVLALAESIAKPSLWRELVVVRYTNVIIFAFAMAACVFFTSGLAKARRVRISPAITSAVPDAALNLLGLALLMLSMGRELAIAAPRADTLLMAFLLLAAGLLVRVPFGAGIWVFVGLGITLACAYLTKSFAFLPSVLLILGLLFYGSRAKGPTRTRLFAGALLLASIFAIMAGPYILAISRQLGHFTTGESARLNYAFFIDLTPRWHEWYHHDLGHAGGTFLHPEAVLTSPPPVFSYAAHPYGTFPLWFDPGWWTLGLKPHVWPKGQVLRLLRNCAMLLRFLLGRPEVLVLLAVLLAFGARWPRLRNSRSGQGWSWAAGPIVWGLLMFGIYFPVDLQDRYLTGPLLLVLLPLFATLQAGRSEQEQCPSRVPVIASALIVLFAGLALSQSVTYLADRRRHIPPEEQHHPGYDPEIFTAAAALTRLGVRPGDKVACMGDVTCYTDFYWARLAGAQILAQVETPNEANPLTVWNNIQEKQTITTPLSQMGLRYLVSMLPNSAQKPPGWFQLGGSNFFAYPLQSPVSRDQASAIAAFHPTP